MVVVGVLIMTVRVKTETVDNHLLSAYYVLSVINVNSFNLHRERVVSACNR